MKILLISGHGNGDSGAIGNGYKEANLTIEMVNAIAPKLKKYATVDVYDTKRNAFEDIKKGNFNIGSYDYMLEVHFNAFNGKGRGTEIYVTSKEKYTTVEQKIMKNMSKYFTLRGKNGVKVEDFSVIKKVKSKGISSALIEICFIDNKEDMNIWKNNKNGIVDAIVKGIVDGFGLKEIKTTNTSNVLNLKNEPLYISSTAKKETKKVSGTYYKWSNEVVNNRIKITNSKTNIGKAGKVTGWIAKK